jgi:hypothetical protein
MYAEITPEMVGIQEIPIPPKKTKKNQEPLEEGEKGFIRRTILDICGITDEEDEESNTQLAIVPKKKKKKEEKRQPIAQMTHSEWMEKVYFPSLNLPPGYKGIKNGWPHNAQERKERDDRLKREAEAKKKKEEKEKAQLLRNQEDKIVELLGKKAQLHIRLDQLNRRDPHDAKELPVIQFRLRHIEEKLEELQKASGINLDNLEEGSKVGRFYQGCRRLWDKTKEIFSSCTKTVKKFFKNHARTIVKTAVMVVPITISALLFKFLTRS